MLCVRERDPPTLLVKGVYIRATDGCLLPYLVVTFSVMNVVLTLEIIFKCNVIMCHFP